jgi:hypothetical protein
MKKNSSLPITARVALSALFLLSGLALFCAIPLVASSHSSIRPRAQTATAPTAPNPTPYSGTYDPNPFPCATTRNTFNVPAGQTRIIVSVAATLQANDLTLTLLYGADPNPTLVQTDDTGVGTEGFIYAPPGGVPPGEYQVEICESPAPAAPPTAPFTYNGTFITDDTPIAGGGAAFPPFGSIPPAAQDTGPKIGFENFSAPGVLVTVVVTEAGQQVNSVEYMGRNAGEPSIGNNWNTGVTAFQSGLETLFVTFNDTCPATGQSSLWVSRPANTVLAIDSDPIGFTDHQTGRTFAGSLTLLSPTCKTSFTDSDGLPTMTAPTGWTPTNGSGLASGVDHETIGGGPYHAPLTGTPAYANAVYYCSQEGVPNTGPPSSCSRSDNGGATFGGSIFTTNPPVNVCGGLHGHVKVSPVDGTVYLPFNECNGVASLLVSLDNAVTWTIQHVNNGTISAQPSASFQDPAVAIDGSGRVYYVIANNDSAAAVFTSDDHGATWTLRGDVGAIPYGLQNIRYPAAVAGDAGRASVAFYGTTTAGDALQGSFNGVWHLYVANTFDGGAHWTTTDATPNAPMQRGCIWAKGGANICRNLLDFFDMTVDKQGRVEVGYMNGCEGGNCAQAVTAADHFGGNAFTNTATIARQSSGRRLFAANDPVTTTSKPGMPSVTQRRIGHVVHLGWSEADTGNSPITGYQILRGTASGAEIPLTTVTGTQTGGTYDDLAAIDTTQTYYYKVQAMNAIGTSCGNNEVAAPYLGDTCTGITIHQNDPTHPEANSGTNTPASLLIDYVAVGEPPGSSDFLFKMKVNSLATIPPNSRWRITWDSFSSPGQQYYVGMTTGNTGAITFEYGTLADANVPAVFVIAETTVASCAVSGTSCTLGSAGSASQYNTDGTITIIVPKSAFGFPQPGDLVGAVGGRTLTGDTSNCATDLPPCTPESKLERSTAFVDHTFVKAQTDDAYPGATYTVVGNNALCAFPTRVVSRKIHETTPPVFHDLDLLPPFPGIEMRRNTGADTTGSNVGHDHQVVFDFGTVTITGVQGCTASGGATCTVGSVTGALVTANLHNVTDVQTLTITLTNVTAGGGLGNVSVLMKVLAGDTNEDSRTNVGDTNQTKSRSGQLTDSTNFRSDVNLDGRINVGDTNFVKAHSGHSLP